MLACYFGKCYAAHMDGKVRRKPRTQEERTASTRGRLMRATLEAILEWGYAGATMADISSRAGVTRGALNHHFASRDDLIIQAFADLLRRTTSEISSLASHVHDGSLSLEGFLDKAWEIFRGPFFLITLEQITAARHNAMLRERLVQVTREFHRALDDIWRRFFSDSALGRSEVEINFNATLCLLRGMGVQSILRNDPAYYRRLLSFWKSILIEKARGPAEMSATG
jgi:AcrR family transcriptional regulator